MSALAGGAETGQGESAPPPALTRRYQRVAWLALGLGLTVFLLLCGGGLYAILRYGEHAYHSNPTHVVLAHGTQLEVRRAGQKAWTLLTDAQLSEGDSVSTGPDTDALLVLFDGSTVQLYYNTLVTVRSTRSSQFLNQEKDIKIEQAAGSLKVATAAQDPYATAWFQVLSAAGDIAVRIPESSAVLVTVPDAASGVPRMQVSTVDGSVSLLRTGSTPWQEIPIGQMCRVYAGDKIQGPERAETKLIDNGSFERPPDTPNELAAGWRITPSDARGGLAFTVTESLRGQVVQAARFSRVVTSTDLATVSIRQEMSQPVNYYQSLQMQAQVKVSAGPCVGGRLYPLTLRVIYDDAEGRQGTWERSFYAQTAGPAAALPACPASPTAVALPDDAWTSLPAALPAGDQQAGWDLMAQSPPPARIKAVEIVATGYSFSASVTDLSLIAR